MRDIWVSVIGVVGDFIDVVSWLIILVALTVVFSLRVNLCGCSVLVTSSVLSASVVVGCVLSVMIGKSAYSCVRLNVVTQ